MAKIDYDNLSLEELAEIRNAVDSAAHKRIDAEKKQVIKSIKEQIRIYGISAKELGFKQESTDEETTTTKAPKTPVEPKFHHPKDPNLTWGGGRGAKPLWLKEFLEKGGKIEQLVEIKK